ncbi:hypothetical protein GM661_12210 [Iocasia frigidifontis]|uniref:Uncharacterized protein n=1 Tax=Iocasia fonsfrigidae TaxID=2682810 RepID=A0A8A7KLF6_9FIRM|nr:hypothetical protein [Iocasia fonsfrigidae]QTL98672.1 hypothetical protein GM661_12210 [Iocasia fonsfrigidae]
MEKKLKKIVLLLLTPLLIFSLTACKIASHNEEAVRAKIKDYLYQKYGEEFVVDRIGTRSDRSGSFYQARIYPKSIIGTNREGDSYYYASASVNKLTLGRLDEPGDSYSYVARNMDVEKYLLPYTKQTFGERVVLKVDVAHKVTGDGSWWAGYKSVSLAEMRKDIAEDPERNRIELELYVYIFDRIDSEREKEERRKQIFDYVQYLKEEGLFKYLELGVIFIDERVLASGYWEYARDIYPANLVEKEVEGETVYLPPRDLREEMSEVLQEEIDGMSEDELLVRMGRIRKSELSYDGIREYNGQYNCWIYSIGMLELYYDITEEDRERDYTTLKDIQYTKYKKYIFIN